MKLLLLFFISLYSCTTAQPHALKAKAPIPPTERAKLCERIAKNDKDFAHCIGVNWETIQ